VTIYFAALNGLFSFVLNMKFNDVFRQELERIFFVIFSLCANPRKS
jgi:hypothetical protein